MVALTVWVIFFAMALFLANSRGRSMTWAILGSLLLTPFVWVVVLAIIGKAPSAEGGAPRCSSCSVKAAPSRKERASGFAICKNCGAPISLKSGAGNDDPAQRIIERAPTLSDPVPEIDGFMPDLGQMDDDETSGRKAADDEGSDAIGDLHFMIEYRDAHGDFSRRRITTVRFGDEAWAPSISAWCHERDDMRTFRLDRISKVIDGRRKVHEPQSFFRSIGIGPAAERYYGFDVVNTDFADLERVASRHRARIRAAERREDEREAQRKRDERWAIRRPGVVVEKTARVLLGLAKADGEVAESEIDAIMAFAHAELAAEGQPMSDDESAAFREKISRMRVGKVTLQRSIDALIGDPRIKLSKAEADRLYEAAETVIDADGQRDPDEEAFVAWLRTQIKPVK